MQPSKLIFFCVIITIGASPIHCANLKSIRDWNHDLWMLEEGDLRSIIEHVFTCSRVFARLRQIVTVSLEAVLQKLC